MNKHKIKHIINSYLAPMIFSFVPVLSHFIIGLYMMKQENTANLGAIICVVGIVCFFCWWFTKVCEKPTPLGMGWIAHLFY